MFMTGLRAKYVRDLASRGRALRTQESYTSYVADLARFLDRSPRLDGARSPLDLIDLNRLGQPSN
jgi:hypothetical protein